MEKNNASTATLSDAVEAFAKGGDMKSDERSGCYLHHYHNRCWYKDN
jgi:hypothetical protein